MRGGVWWGARSGEEKLPDTCLLQVCRRMGLLTHAAPVPGISCANLYNLGIIGGALLAPWLGIYGLVAGVVAGALLFLLVQLPGLRAVGARYTPASQRKTKTTGQREQLIELGALMPSASYC